jgi:glycosyltransferase involved in cell wall biosynthesis
MKILYVVHRYAPYQGGTENYVKDMAEETLSRGHEVWALAQQHHGNYNGVRLTSDPEILNRPWDMIIVHGTQRWQQYILRRFRTVKSPTIFMPVEMPSDPEKKLKVGFQFSKYVAYSTKDDYRALKVYNMLKKAVHIRHGISDKDCIGTPGFKKKYGIATKNMILSSGGFWKHKNMQNLIDNFQIAGLKDTTLVLTGYWDDGDVYSKLKYDSSIVKVFKLDSRQDVLDAMVEADLYVLNSTREGFGIVLLEAMLNKLPWISRPTPGAVDLEGFGTTYDSDAGLIDALKNFKSYKTDEAYSEVTTNRLIKNTVDDIFNVINLGN